MCCWQARAVDRSYADEERLPRGKEPLKLIIRRPNYKDQTVDANVGSDVSLTCRLNRSIRRSQRLAASQRRRHPREKWRCYQVDRACGWKTGPSRKCLLARVRRASRSQVKTQSHRREPQRLDREKPPVAGGKPTGKTMVVLKSSTRAVSSRFCLAPSRGDMFCGAGCRGCSTVDALSLDPVLFQMAA